MAYLQTENLKKSYGQGETYTPVLKGISFGVEKGTLVAIQGNSGSGKSTLLNCIGGLDTPDSGSIVMDGQQVVGLNEQALSRYRRSELGFIFQFYNLIPNLTVRENIQVCEYLTKHPLDMENLLRTLGLKEHENKFPSQLSGDQQQRCAIARALIKNPNLLLCDEPTGALDSATSREILLLLEQVNRDFGTTMLIVTHNNAIRQMVDQVIVLKDGKIADDYRNKEKISAALLEDL
ncbi:MAG: ABC transporter ATP-binding protein [Lachnospiraceae bacterium]|nr:ABC transporter ATP-binding protein [Lachnospiraceae bacterium]